MGKLQGKIAVVTGGNSGIGLATAKLYKDEGAQVIITARSPETFKTAQAEYGHAFDVVQADLSKIADVKKFTAHIEQKYKRIDVLFVNHGIAEFRATEEVDEEFFDRHFNTNVRGLYFTVANALPLLKKGSAVVLNASVVASKGFVGSSVYSGTKAAVRNFARTWASEWASRGIRVNVLSPGPIDTPIQDKMVKTPEERDATRKAFAQMVPLGRMGLPEEMAKVALFLGSDDSSFMTGAEVMADGGTGQV